MAETVSKLVPPSPPEEAVAEALKPKGQVLKNLIFHTLNIGSTFLLLSVGSILTARFLGTARMGQYGLLTTFASTVTNVGTLGLVDVTSRFVAQYMAEGNRKLMLGFIRFGLVFELVICLVAALAISLFALPLSQIFSLNGGEAYFILTALMVAPAMLGGMFTSILAGIQRYDLIAIVKIATTFPLLAMTIAVLMLQYGITGLLVINIAVNFVTLLIWVILILRLVPLFEKGSFTRVEFVRTAKFSFSMMMLTVLNIVVWQRSEVFFLSIFRTDREVGLYVIPFVLSSVFANLIANILHVLIPALADMVGKGDLQGMARLFRTSARITAIVATPVSLGGIFLASQLLDTLYGGDFADGTTTLRILFVATLASTIAAGGSYTIVSTAPSSWLFLGVMSGLGILSLTLDLLIIPQFGATGAALCNTGVQLIAPFIYDRVLRGLHGFGYPGRKLFGIIGLGLLSLVLAFAFKLLAGGWPGPVGGSVLFAIVYLWGLVGLKLIYQEDLEVFSKLVRRLPGRIRRSLETRLEALAKKLPSE